MDTLMILACSIVWIIVTMVFRIFTPLTLRIELLVLWVLIFLFYLFLVFYIPYKKKLDTAILDAKQEYFDNKDKLDPIYADQLKRKWMDDMITRNKYYIMMFVIWCYIPIPFYMIYLLYPTANQFTLENYIVMAVVLVLTSMSAFLLRIGYSVGLMQMVYVIAAFVGTILLSLFLSKHLVLAKHAVFMVLVVIAALCVWGITKIGILPVLYMFIALIFITGAIYSIIS